MHLVHLSSDPEVLTPGHLVLYRMQQDPSLSKPAAPVSACRRDFDDRTGPQPLVPSRASAAALVGPGTAPSPSYHTGLMTSPLPRAAARPPPLLYFGFGFRLRLIALQAQRRESGFTRGVAYSQDSHPSQPKHPSSSLKAATTGSKSFFPKLAHSL
jgi:hypothetical protein